jgi:hypothetical protein
VQQSCSYHNFEGIVSGRETLERIVSSSADQIHFIIYWDCFIVTTTSNGFISHTRAGVCMGGFLDHDRYAENLKLWKKNCINNMPTYLRQSEVCGGLADSNNAVARCIYFNSGVIAMLYPGFESYSDDNVWSS